MKPITGGGDRNRLPLYAEKINVFITFTYLPAKLHGEPFQTHSDHATCWAKHEATRESVSTFFLRSCSDTPLCSAEGPKSH